MKYCEASRQLCIVIKKGCIKLIIWLLLRVWSAHHKTPSRNPSVQAQAKDFRLTAEGPQQVHLALAEQQGQGLATSAQPHQSVLN